ncbi:MAG: carbamoyl transferase [Alphaproteobacteria bacterium]|nr:carbamoyl transferase [Alphaproteobacteria bacterium]MBV9370813.1 carbamoyl transferase [Alphaproteobacteria bacterium]MBV9900107.1 carbamoyl transferase [Alphaproteobacteria bacterium]
MSAVLGISAYYHDSAAALIVDGKIVAAMQEERFSRRKNDAGLPHRAAQACLTQAGITADELDSVVFYENPFGRLERVILSSLGAFPRSWRHFPAALRSQIGNKIWVLDGIASMLDIPRSKVTMAGHHESHAASAFFPSPFGEAAILTVDGMGEDVATAIWHGRGSELRSLATIPYPHSIGLLYAAITAYLGFEVNEGEYKVMGLAAFGAPRFKPEFEKLLRLHADGAFELGMEYFAFHTDTNIAFSPRLEQLLGPAKRRGEAWDLSEGSADRRFADIAASLQWITEEALLGLAREVRRRTGTDNLCLAGGVALNCVANARLLRESGFARIFVQPAAGDAGGALGAAMLGAIKLDGRRPSPMSSAALGTAVSTDRARELCGALGVAWSEPSDVLDSAADMILDGKVGAFARGRFEWGPRALGQRSIVASPREGGMRDRINMIVKKREPFRPFAPAVLRDRAGDWFTEHENDMTPYMTTTAQVVEGRAGDLGAVRHVDGSARVQTVAEAEAPDFFGLLERIERRGAPPIILNTSLNGNGEPIVGGEADALGFFMSHPVDFMVLGDIVLRKGTPA